MAGSLLNPILSPFLALPPLLGVAVLSLILTLIVNIIYKFTTNQRLMKELKDDLKKFQKQMKEVKTDTAKMLEIQKKMMEKNMEYMKHSLKATLFTMLPVLLIFGWMSANYSYEPIRPGQDFNVTLSFITGATGEVNLSYPDGITVLNGETQRIANEKVVYLLQGVEGEHLLEFKFGDASKKMPVTISSKWDVSPPDVKIKDSVLKEIRVSNKPIKPINLFGLQLSWLWTYLIFSVGFNILIRKIMDLH